MSLVKISMNSLVMRLSYEVSLGDFSPFELFDLCGLPGEASFFWLTCEDMLKFILLVGLMACAGCLAGLHF